MSAATPTNGSDGSARRARFQGKVVLVTGSSRGIGREIAAAFAAEGAHVVITSCDAGEVHAVHRQFEEHGWSAMPCVADVRDAEAIARMVEAILARWSAIDILVNNAAIFPKRIPFLEIPFENWREVIDVNLFGVVRVTQAVGRVMARQSEGGRIVNISSLNASRYRVTTIGQTQYNVAKAALDNLTMGLAMELAPHGIIVNAIAPGFVDSTTLGKEDGQDDDPLRQDYLEGGRIPLRRYGQPRDCANLVLFLASPECTYMAGETVRIDGGLSFIF
ncbi:MAG: 3-oxoacyl-(acyl-carrier-protein) reductase FabG [candidate division BRC1 bacterium ADurb.BinA292]|nr:MAG: 3-oxoacyl-(acyl-carrier-protein) reductase FabG [candidate division BRC1 bacterium ADurb.BinA292]